MRYDRRLFTAIGRVRSLSSAALCLAKCVTASPPNIIAPSFLLEKLWEKHARVYKRSEFTPHARRREPQQPCSAPPPCAGASAPPRASEWWSSTARGSRLRWPARSTRTRWPSTSCATRYEVYSQKQLYPQPKWTTFCAAPWSKNRERRTSRGRPRCTPAYPTIYRPIPSLWPA